MDKKQLQLVWWLCMLPSFVATSMFYYEWTRHEAETILLTFAIVCLMMGVVFGTLIVWSASGADQQAMTNKKNDAEELPECNSADLHNTEPETRSEESVPLPQPASLIVNSLPEQVLEFVDEVPAVNSDLSKLFGQLSDTVAGASHHEEHSCPSDRWTVPVEKEESVHALTHENRTVEELLNHADVLIAQENYDEAIKLYDHVVRADANNFDAWFLKAVALRKKQRCQDSIYCINFALSIKRTSVVAMVEKGECLLQLDRADQAIIWFDKALSQDKIAIAPWIGKARCLVKMGETNSSMACYDKVLSLQPDHTEAITAREELAKKAAGAKKSKAVG